MRKLLFLAILSLLFLAPKAHAATIALAQSESSTAAYTGSTVPSVSATFDSNTVTGNAIIVTVQYGASSGNRVSGCRDTVNTTSSYVRAATAFSVTKTQGQEVWYALNITGGTTPQVTCTFSTASNFTTIAIHEYSGIAASGALDATSTNVIDTASTTLTTGTSTTGTGKELIFGSFIGTGNGNWTFTHGAGFTTRVDRGAAAGMDTEDEIQSSAGAVSAFATASPADTQANVMATFKAAVTTTAPVPYNRVILMDW